jgi:hypothetical protein
MLQNVKTKPWRISLAEHVACMGEIKYTYKILVGKPKGKRLLTRTRHTQDNTEMDFGDIGLDVVEWIHMAQDRDWWWTFVNSKEPLGSTKGREFLD